MIVELKSKLMDHQKDAVEYSREIKKFIIGDQPGLGKTLEVIAIALENYVPNTHCLIICGVNGLKWNWKEEIEKHVGIKSTVIGERKRRDGFYEVKGNADKIKALDNLEDYFIITNIESLRNEEFTKRLAELCECGKISMIAYDEAHTSRNPNCQQAKALMKLQADRMIAVTGTILMNSPLDLFVPLKWLGYEKASFFIFKKMYCIMGGFGNYQIIGYRRLDTLQRKLESVMIRRLKDDVLDLPPLIFIPEYVEMGIAQHRVYNEILMATKLLADKIKTAVNPLSQLIRLRQATADTSIVSSVVSASAKLDRLEELVSDIVESGESVVIFSNWSEVTGLAMKRLAKYKPAIITGEVKDRQQQKDYFMNDPNCHIIIGTMGAMGAGYTLTKATTVIFLDLPYTWGQFEQCYDRIRRIGTVGESINVIILITKNTIDERVYGIVNSKKRIGDALVDNVYDLTKPETIDYLLN